MFLLVGLVFLSASLPVVSATVSTSDETNFDYKSALKLSQDAIGNQIGSHAVTAISNNIQNLDDFRGKPLVVSLIFTSCFDICPMTTRHLVKMVNKAKETLGNDSFNVAVIGFDTRADTLDAMRFFAEKQDIDTQSWELLSIDDNVLKPLVKELGFSYFPSARGFDHILQTTIIDAKGIVYRQVYGQAFDTPLLVEPLMELVLGKPKPNQGFVNHLANKVRLFCTSYDPVNDTYYFDYSLFIGLIIGGTIIILGFIFVIKELLRFRREA